MDVPGCGGCHPGGGGLEFDRSGKRYDKQLLSNPGLKKKYDGDYYNSSWDKTGVVEADCFICHLKNYNFPERNRQLKLWNFRWSSTAASGIAVVTGTVAAVKKENGKIRKVLSGKRPVVQYNKRLFNSDGKLSVDLSWPPPSKNCTFCHGYSDRKKRGFSWNDPENHDIHNLSGMECVHCHPSIDDMHNFAKGDENISSVRDDLDNKGMMSCEKCHTTGSFGASKPRHRSVRPSHIKRISCTTCHIPYINANGGATFDVTSGAMINYGKIRNSDSIDPERPGKVEFVPIPKMNRWIPVYSKNHKTDKIEPTNPFPRGLIYSNKDSDGIYYPLFMKEIVKTYGKVKGKITKQPFKKGPYKGKPKLYKDGEIKIFLSALKETLKGNKRFKEVDPHMHFFGTLISLDKNENLFKRTDKTWAGRNEAFNINHNVAPAQDALGAGGCSDCHGWNGKVFRNPVLTKLWNEKGNPEFVRNGKLIGCNIFTFWTNVFYQTVITPYVSIIILVIGFLIILHYTGQGPKGADLLLEPATIQRFTISERWAHLIRMISFILLAFTGGIFFYNSTRFIEIFFDTQANAVDWHIVSGVIFTIASLLSLRLWYKDARFEEYDREWLSKMGGYFSGTKDVHAPAGRLNAGQKIAFWWIFALSVIMALTGIFLVFKGYFPLALNCFITTIHGLFSIVFLATIIGHAYLGTLANPGTWRTMLDGMVGEKWAQKHHSEWYKKLFGTGDKKIQDEDIEEK